LNGSILTNRSAIDRNKSDFYETPPEVTTALLQFLEDAEHLTPGKDIIWEPACGAGKMAEVMRMAGYDVICTDLNDFGYGRSGVDFLETSQPCDWIITNPPFKYATEFVRHALELGFPCAFLLKSQFWHARSRMQLFRENQPTYVLPLTWRPDFLYGAKSGSPTMDILWTVWAGGHDAKYWPLRRMM
jgi:hypothetical protein